MPYVRLLQGNASASDPDMRNSLYSLQAGTMITLGLLELHLLRRVLETAFLLHYREGASMHFLTYISGFM